jgi:hypothetical protein
MTTYHLQTHTPARAGGDPADYVRTERQRPCMDDGADLPTDVLVDTCTATSLRSGAMTLAATKKLAPPRLLRRRPTICSCSRATQLDDANDVAKPTHAHAAPLTYRSKQLQEATLGRR